MQRIQKAWGHTAHRGWACLLFNRARDLIIHGPAHQGANGTEMPTDDDDQGCLFFFNHPERGGLLRCLGARSHCYCCLVGVYLAHRHLPAAEPTPNTRMLPKTLP